MLNSYNIQEIRILPISDNHGNFNTEDDVVEKCFLNLKKDGKYYYENRGLILGDRHVAHQPDVLILFQYDGSIIGYGMLKDIKEVPLTEVINDEEIYYKGYFEFSTESIHNTAHISFDEIKQIDECFTKSENFTNSKSHIDVKHRRKICNLLKRRTVN